MDIRLTQLAAVGVDRQSAADLDRTVGDVILGLTGPAEAEFFELDQRERREVVVENGRLDVDRLQSRLLPELATHQSHLGQT